MLARVEGKIREERSQREMRPEIRYRYMEAGLENFAVLGKDWEEAYEFLLVNSEEAVEMRRRLAADIQAYLKAFDTRPKKIPLAQRLKEELDRLRTALELGEEDPIYRRYVGIYQHLVRKYDLPVEEVVKGEKKEGGPGGKGSEVPPDCEAELGESPSCRQYREIFEAFYEDGDISEDERAILVEQQVELGLSDEQVQEIEIEIISRRRKGTHE